MGISQYTGMAALYDTLMDDVDYRQWADMLLREISNAFGPNASLHIADCACGTGSLTIPLAKAGHHLTGIDLSSDMLRVAQEKSMRAGLRIPYVQMDIQFFKLHRPADIVICCCDGVNYLTGTHAAENFFLSAASALKENGLFLFDVSSEYKLEHILGNSMMGDDRPECTYLWENCFDPKSRLLEMRLHFFLPETTSGKQLWKRFDETHLQRAYSEKELLSLLEKTGFQCVSVKEAFTGNAPSPETERLQFTARRIK